MSLLQYIIYTIYKHMKRYSKTQLFDNKYYLSSYLINPNRIKQLYINYSQIQNKSRLILALSSIGLSF